MTVSTTSNRVEYTGDGSNTLFDFSFRVLAKSDLELSVYDTVAGTTTTVAAADFSVTTLPADSGTVTYPVSGTPVSATERLIIVRVVDQTQLVDINNQTGFDAAVVEEVFDKLTMITQQLSEELGRALKLPVADDAVADIPSAVARASRFLGFDANGDLTVLNSSGANAVDTPWQGAWVTGTFYAVNDLVGNAGSIYICVEAHTAGADFATDLAAGKWELFVTSGSGTLDIDSLTAITSLATADTIPLYDDSAGTNRKITAENIFTVIPNMTLETTLNGTNDFLVVWDGSANAPRRTTVRSVLDLINVLTANTTPAKDDRIVFYDTTALAARRASFENAFSVISQFTETTDIALTDFFAMYDDSASLPRKVAPATIFKTINLLTEDVSPDTTADFVATWDNSASSPKKVKLNAISGGGMVFLATADAASSATIDFTAFNAALYDGYVFLLQNVLPATNGVDLIMRTSTDGGSTYDSTAGNYSTGVSVLSHSAVTTSASEFPSATSTTTYMLLAPSISNAADGVSGMVYLAGPHLARKTNANWNLVWGASASTSASCVGSGTRHSGADVDAIRFLTTSGNISTGTITMYGLKAL